MQIATKLELEQTNLPTFVEGLAFLTDEKGNFVSEHKTFPAAQQRCWTTRNQTVRLYQFFEFQGVSGWNFIGTWEKGRRRHDDH